MNTDWVHLFGSIDVSLAEKVVRTVVIYLVIAILIRVAGKRLLAQMNALDLVVVLLLSNVVQNAIIGPDNSLLGGVIGAIVLVAFNAALDRLAQASDRVRWLLEGRPTTLVTDGTIVEPAVRRLGLTDAELSIALARLGADEASEVERAELVPGGDITIELKRGERTATYDELRDAVAELKAYIDGRLPS